MKVTTKGQVTIPVHIRDYLGIRPHSEVEFSIREGSVVLNKAEGPPAADERKRFASMRGILGRELSTDQWMEATRGD